ncbi:MAG: replication protein [Armatimonadota bacterium]
MSEDYSPQLIKGHTRLSNEWLEELLRSSYPGRIKDFVLAVARCTWGWHETWRAVPIGDFCDILGVGERQAYKLRDDALRHNLIGMAEAENGTATPLYCVQKLYLDWIMYRPTQTAREKARLRYLPRTNNSEGRTSQDYEGHTSQDCEGRTSQPPIYKESSKEKAKESAPAMLSDKERRNLKRRQLLNEQEVLLSEVPQAHRELLDGFIENCAAANDTGTITLSREVTEIRALLSVREEVGVEAWVYGMFQANAKRATAINYIKKAAGSYRPGSSNGGLPADSPLLKMRGPARAEAFERTKPLEPPRF